MHQVTLGKTGLTVRRLGFGGIPIQRVDEAGAVATVVRAIESGVDFIDTARAYTTSEERIGTALREFAGKRVVIASKSGERTADGITRDIETSLTLLGRDYIDLYQCHYVRDREDYRKILAVDGALTGLLRARDAGMIRHIGVTSHSLDLLDRVLEDDIFETVMVCFSFMEPAARETVIPKALAKNVGVIAMKSFSGGVLDDPGAALKYVLGQPGIVVIPGVESPALFDENWSVFQGDWHLTDDERQTIENTRATLDRLFCRRCDYCQPCSEDIPIQLVMGIKFAVKRFGGDFLEKGWGKSAIAKARHCSECGDCMTRCPYDLPITDLIKAHIEWVDNGCP